MSIMQQGATVPSMLSISVLVNGQPAVRVNVVNLGPPGGVYEGDDHAGGGGVRDYAWIMEGRDLGGRVQHRRSDGAVTLARLVLADIEASRP